MTAPKAKKSKAPAKKATKAAVKKTTSFEETLWDSANKLRGSVESSEYKHIGLSLIFLKFISDKFEAQRLKLQNEGMGDYLEVVDFYTKDNVFYLPIEARWEELLTHAKQDDIALKIDTALHTIEKNNKSLAGALPDNYFSRLGLESNKLAALLDTINNIDTYIEEQVEEQAGIKEGEPHLNAEQKALAEEDLVGRVYEYFLGKFAASEGKGGGEFYTPKSVVALLAEMLEPYKGKIYDPCCGSGGMFVQSIKFINSHNGNQKDISIYGQEYTSTTYKLAKMNLAIRGISGNLGEVAGDTFFKDQHPDLKADFIMANPPFNQKQWRSESELVDDPRWAGYTAPPTGNANYAWILHMLSKLSESGTAGFVLANGSMSSNTSGEGKIRQEIIDNDHVDCMIALPGQLFYTTQIPVCLWFLSKNKGEVKNPDGSIQRRDRKGETLFIDARQMGTMISRTNKELTDDDLAKIAGTYHAWRSGTETENPQNVGRPSGRQDNAPANNTYQDIAGYCKSATLEEIKNNDYVLTPGRYVGAAEIEDDGIPFEDKMRDLSQTLYQQMQDAQALDAAIKKNLAVLGYKEQGYGE
jgi:type I restriction enzyme M protein